MRDVGIRNVRAVWARWSHLSHPPFRLLSYMAYRTKDDDDPPLFWGGREELAYALGRMVPPEPEPTDLSARASLYRKQRESDFQAVKIAVKPLVEVQVLLVVRRAAGRQPAVYALRLGEVQGEAEPTPVGRPGLPLSEDFPTPVGRPGLPLVGGDQGGAPNYERRQEEKQDLKPDNNSSQVSNSLVNDSENDEKRYSAARDYLETLPDLGAALLATTDPDQPLRSRVIEAFQKTQNANTGKAS